MEAAGCLEVQGGGQYRMARAEASHLRVQLRQKSLGHMGTANEMDVGSVRWVQAKVLLAVPPQSSRLSHLNLVGSGPPCAAQRFHVEHRAQSRWIVGAASLSGCTPKCSPWTRPVIKNDIGLARAMLAYMRPS